MPAPWEMDWSAPAPPAPAAEAASAAKPWEKDWSAEAAKPKTFRERGFVDSALGLTGERYQFFPERMARGIGNAIVSGVTLPRDVLQGKVDLRTEEGLKEAAPRAFDAVSLVNPASVAARTGPQIARRAFSPGEANPEFRAPSEAIKAGQTAVDLGAPLPAGLVSENKGVQALTQASRSMPIVGGALDKRVGSTIDAAGNAVKEIAEGLSGGVPDRATAGANLRPSLKGVIEDNNGRIDSAFAALRHVVDADKIAPLPRTQAAYDSIVAKRTAAKQANPKEGLSDTVSLLKRPEKPVMGPTVLRGVEALNDEVAPGQWGASFNGLQRARSDIGNKINFGEANPGFDKGDFKRLYAAMSGDMENVVRANARNGVTPDQAAQVLKTANAGTAKLIEHNKNIQKLLNIQNDESVVGSVIKAAQDKTGNAKLLMQLRSQMPKQDFEQIVGVALSELGHNPSSGQFSLAQFGTGYRKLGDTAKSILFNDPAHRKALDDIANLDRILKDSDKYINKSGTGRVDTMTKVIGGGGALAGAAASGNIPAVLGALGAGAGGFGLAKYLGRPATASALAKWMKAAESAPRIQNSAARSAMLTMASRNLMNNLPGLKRLEAPAADDQRPDNDAVGNPERRQIPGRQTQ